MTEPVLSYHRIDVEFNPEAIGNPDIDIFTFTREDGLPLPDKSIKVDPGIGMIIFKLSTKPPADGPPPFPQATFQTYPIQWLEAIEGGVNNGANSGQPTLTPGMFVVQRIGDNILTLIDYNSNPSDDPFDMHHWFNLVVLYQGQTYGSDPVIVNQPPDT